MASVAISSGDWSIALKTPFSASVLFGSALDIYYEVLLYVEIFLLPDESWEEEFLWKSGIPLDDSILAFSISFNK